jgi:hypothetical protein
VSAWNTVKGTEDVFFALYATVRGELLNKHGSLFRDMLSVGQQMTNIILYSKDYFQSREFVFGISSDDPWCVNIIVGPGDKNVGLCLFGYIFKAICLDTQTRFMKFNVIHCEVVQSNCGRYYELSEVRQHCISRIGTAKPCRWVPVIRDSLCCLYCHVFQWLRRGVWSGESVNWLFSSRIYN